MKETIAMLGSLAALKAKTDKAEMTLVERADARFKEVTGKLDKLRPSISTDPKAAEEFQELVMDRGYCARVIEQAKGHTPKS